MPKIVNGLYKKVETKTIAAPAGAGGGAVVSGFVLYLLGVIAYNASATANSGADAVGAVPAPVTAFTVFVLATIGAWVASYLAPHTSRTVVDAPDLVAHSYGLSDAGAPAYDVVDQPDFGSDPVDDIDGTRP